MKDLKLIVWLTQLGLSVAFPLAGSIILALWLRDKQGWGDWVLIAGILLGVVLAVDGLRMSLKAMERMSRSSRKDTPPPQSFNDHD